MGNLLRARKETTVTNIISDAPKRSQRSDGARAGVQGTLHFIPESDLPFSLKRDIVDAKR
jgi:hypothetical protein